MSTIGVVSPISIPVDTLFGVTAPTVIPTSDSSLSSTAVSLSGDASVVASLGNAVSPDLALYDPSGLLNSLSQAGTQTSAPIPIPPQGTDISSLTQQASNFDIVSTLGGDPSSTGLYSTSGSATVLPPDLSVAFAGLLKSDPNLARTVISDSLNQGLVKSIDVLA
jgi:hypothetical protein